MLRQLRRSARGSGGTVGRNDDSDEAWEAEMRLRQDVLGPPSDASQNGNYADSRCSDYAAIQMSGANGYIRPKKLTKSGII